MSAFVVGTDHIDYLVTAAAVAARHPYGLGIVLVTDVQAEHIRAMGGADALSDAYGEIAWHPEQNLPALGRVLLWENTRSVATRYPDDEFDQLPGPVPMVTPGQYRYMNVSPLLVHPAQTIRAVECWQYQTCEYDGHDQAPGWKAAEVLYRAAVRDLVGDLADLQWEWARPVQASS